jgi:steroid delta-isomerase-like uncharacterized protein
MASYCVDGETTRAEEAGVIAVALGREHSPFTSQPERVGRASAPHYRAWHNHEADAIAAAFSENSNYTHPALPEPLVGGTAVAEWAKTVWTILPDFKLDLVSRDATENDLVVNEWVYRGTETGPHPDGTPPTDRAAKSPGVTISQYEEDKIRWQRVYMDPLDEQLQHRRKGGSIKPLGFLFLL